jgi:hypothetical protein
VSGHLQFSSVVAAACLVGACFPSFDGLSGANPSVSDAASGVIDGTEVFEDALVDGSVEPADAGGSEAGVPATCTDSCPGNGYCQGSDCVYASCKDRKASLPNSPSGVYFIDPDLYGTNPAFLAYCAMSVSDGGWTLLMKVDGNAKTFVYDSPLWENSGSYQADAPGYDLTEAKLASYSLMRFANLLVGIRLSANTHFAILAIGGSSLRDLMISGYHASGLGRAGWEMISQGSLQTYCNAEGINVSTPLASMRIGIVSNDSDDCSTCDSFIGFGAWYQRQNSFACGNLAQLSPDNGDRQTPLFGYILAR